MRSPLWLIRGPDEAMAQSATTYFLRLYVSGATPCSARAIRNITLIGAKYLEGKFELEVIDAYQHANRAQAADIIALPTLLKYYPMPMRRIIGDLSDTEHTLRGLGLWPIG
jgi:circadian clock protein KaiB